MGHDKNKSAAPPPGPGPLPYLKKLVHPCVRLPACNIFLIIKDFSEKLAFALL